MNKEEYKEDVRETFNISLKDEEILPVKKNTKIKIIISIISTVLILVVITTLLIGHFKYNWFKNEV